MAKSSLTKRVLVTRQLEQSGTFVNSLSKLKHYPFLLPMIETVQLFPTIDDGCYEVVIFTSANSVRYFAPYNYKINGLMYIAVGAKTAEAMKFFLNITPHLVPKVYDLGHMKRALSTMNLVGSKILTPGAKVRLEDPMVDFEELGAEVFAPAVYETNFAEYPKGYIENFLFENNINVLTFCSPSAAKSFFNQVNIEVDKYEVVSIGETTYDYLKSINIESKYPEKFTVESMAEII